MEISKQPVSNDKAALPSESSTGTKKSWGEAIKSYMDKRAWVMLLLGFSSGLPYLLIFSSLSIWLKEAGFDIKIITLRNGRKIKLVQNHACTTFINGTYKKLAQKLGETTIMLSLAPQLRFMKIPSAVHVPPDA